MNEAMAIRLRLAALKSSVLVNTMRSGREELEAMSQGLLMSTRNGVGGVPACLALRRYRLDDTVLSELAHMILRTVHSLLTHM
ncbi:MAG: hypothetical protein AB1925_04845 [Actinomycetota bacterium]